MIALIAIIALNMGKETDYSLLSCFSNITVAIYDILITRIELWLDENKKEGEKYIPCISTSPISSPEFGETTENGTEVTFRYQQESGGAPGQSEPLIFVPQ